MLARGTADSALIRQVKDDMRNWCLSKVIWVADRGFTSAENRLIETWGKTLQQRTELTRAQRGILKALQIDAPPRIYQLKLPAEP